MKFFLEGVSSSNSLFLRAEFHYLTSYVLLRCTRRSAEGKDSKGHSMLTLLPALLLASPGANNGTCEPWCKWIPVPVQPLVPLCAGCNEQSSKRGLDEEEMYADGRCANWCQWVPDLCRNARPATEQSNRLATVLGGANGCRCRSNRRSLDAKAVATPWQVRRHWHWRKPPAPQAWLRRDCPVGAQRGVSSARGACAAQRVERASRPASCRPLSSCKP